tara:strand:- start:1462 stop:1770 length:309 start_codon:yes stop_codon:yes gene_type:complete
MKSNIFIIKPEENIYNTEKGVGCEKFFNLSGDVSVFTKYNKQSDFIGYAISVWVHDTDEVVYLSRGDIGVSRLRLVLFNTLDEASKYLVKNDVCEFTVYPTY